MTSVRLSRFLCGLGLAVCIVASSTADADEFRTWSDASGQFKLEAKLVSQTADKVKIADKSGENFEIAISQLSQADRDYLKQLAANPNPFKKVDNNPFKKAGDLGPGMKLTPREVTVDWNASRAIPLAPAKEGWSHSVAAGGGLGFTPRPVSLPPKSDFFEGHKGTAINPRAKRAAVGYSMKPPGRRDGGNTRVVLCDLEGGRIVAGGTADYGEMAPLALFDDGQRILMRRNEFGFGNQDRLEIWTVSDGAVSKGMSWIPYDDHKGAARDVLWAEVVDDTTLITSSRSGKIAFWNIDTAQPQAHFQTVDGGVPALSGDRKTLAFCTGDKIGLLDVASKTVTAMQPVAGRMQWPYLAFSPSGTRLACIAFDRILAWDAVSGELLRDFKTPGLNIHGGVAFPADGFVLANKNYLIDLENQIKLWQFDGSEETVVAGEFAFFAVNDQRADGALLPVKLPHQAATDLLDQALNRPDLFVFRSGTTVKLDVSGIPADHRAKVESALTAKLKEMDCPVAANGTITLKASVTGPTKKTMSYIGSGDYDVQEYRMVLTFDYQGTQVWSTGGTNIPAVVTIGRGENLEGILRQKSKGPNYSFYDSVTLPKFLQNPIAGTGSQGQHTLGRSKVTQRGLQ